MFPFPLPEDIGKCAQYHLSLAPFNEVSGMNYGIMLMGFSLIVEMKLKVLYLS
jgi:hypothetical protein